jgi:hypothetical protein
MSSCILSLDDNRFWGFAYDQKTGNFTARLIGRKFVKWVGTNFYGRPLIDFHSPADYEEAKRLLTISVTTPIIGRTSGRLFTIDSTLASVDSYIVTGERIVLPLADDGQTGDGIFGASDYVPPPLLGPFKIVHENVEWYAI